jgi:acyl carrier protein
LAAGCANFAGTDQQSKGGFCAARPGRAIDTTRGDNNTQWFSFRIAEENPPMASVQQRVIAVTARVLGLDPDQVRPEHVFTTDLGAESVQSVELVAMFEEEFGIEMDEDDALSVQSVGDAVTYIAQVCRAQGVAV